MVIKKVTKKLSPKGSESNTLFHEFLAQLNGYIDYEKAKFYPKFFKAGPGEYAEGDQFLGVTVPNQRKVAKKFADKFTLSEIALALNSEWHEVRLTGLFILVLKFQKTKDSRYRQDIAEFYLKHTKCINNWDLVDTTAPQILGEYLLDRDKKPLYKLAKSNDLWENRIAVLSCFTFIRRCEFDDILFFCELFLNHPHDLIHKATGWMLREVGKKDIKTLLGFLEKYHHKMPRTMLRYAIEKLPEKQRKYWLTKESCQKR